MYFGDDIPPKVKPSIMDLIEKEGYLTHETLTQKISTNGSNYVGDLYEIDITGEIKDGAKTTNLFMKIIKDAELKWLNINDMYQTELFAYKKLSNIFTELQDAANIPLQDRYKMVKSYKDSNSEVIILENIVKQGFKTIHRMEIVTLNLAEISIRELAKFHALSFIYQKKELEYFDKFVKNIKYPLNFNDDLREYIGTLIDLTMNYVDTNDRIKVKNVYNKLADKYSHFFEDEATQRCICHGDYRSSNTMVKENNGDLTDFVAIDYQTMYYGCPAMDFIYFIFLNTDQKFRKAYLSHLKDLYHEALKTFLEYFKVSVNSVYSKEMFELDFKQKLDYGLLVGFVWLPLIVVKEDDVPDIGELVSGASFRIDDVYKERQRGMIEEFIEWRYI